MEDILFVLIDEFAASDKLNKHQKMQIPALKRVFHNYQGHQCSMFGVWGDRTENGNLFSARNLDWLTDLGINKYKLLTVHHPPEGNAHVTVGFAGNDDLPLIVLFASESCAHSRMGCHGRYVL